MTQQIINRLCIIGVGLIGGSLARALKKAGQVGEVVGAGRDIAHLEKAKPNFHAQNIKILLLLGRPLMA